MDVHVTGRACGKTFQTIEWLKANPTGLLICVEERMANRLRRAHSSLANRILTTRDAMAPGFKAGDRPYAVDDADLVLARLLGRGRIPDRLTMTGHSLVDLPAPATFLRSETLGRLRQITEGTPDEDLYAEPDRVEAPVT